MQRVTWILAYILAVFAICEANTLTATCSMTGVSAVSTEKISGTVNFEQVDASSTVTVKVDLTGFDTSDSRTQHGFHVHQIGSTGSNCADAGSHFNGKTAGSTTHGGPSDTNRHVGDLGNVAESNGKVQQTLTDTVISLKPDSNNYIIGRAIVIHQDRDDLGDGGVPASSTTGDAGSRIGCCVIEASGARHIAFSFTLLALCMAVLAGLKN